MRLLHQLLPYLLPHTATLSAQTNAATMVNQGQTSSQKSGQERGRNNPGLWCHPPRCQICRRDGHFTDWCHERYSHSDITKTTTHLTKDFEESCSLNGLIPQDTIASVHVSNDPSNLDQSTHYTGKDCLIVGNGTSLPIIHTSKIFPFPIFHC